MISLKSLVCESLNRISLQQAVDNKFFGPVYHGTSEEARGKIDKEGFKIVSGLFGTSGMANGYIPGGYSPNITIPAPIHHLGFGVYFTTVLSIAKQFNHGTSKGLVPYYLDTPDIEEINFGSPNTMMKWWIQNGYDPELAVQGEGGRYKATMQMTEHLKSKYGAVWYKGKGLYKLLDGDQVCVYDTSKIYQVDRNMTNPGEVGSKVIAKIDIDPYSNGNITVAKGTVGVITKREKRTDQQHWAEGSNFIYQVHFKKGGRQYNLLDKHIEPYSKTK